MLLLSTLLACLHLGVRPPAAVFGGVEVYAPVAEPGVDEALRSALLRALAARQATAASGATVEVRITEAALTPAVRGDPAAPGGGLWYLARLRADVDAGGRARSFEVRDWVPETGAVPDRAAVFDALAGRLAAEAAAWAAAAP